jgi:DNA-directed RNA polymerase alpha subunit
MSETLDDLFWGEASDWCHEEQFSTITRAYNGLKLAGLLTIGQIAARSDAELLQLPNMGRKSVATIRVALASRGLQIGQFAGGGARSWPMSWYLSQLGDA